MKTNDIKITQRAEYYYTAIDLFQTVHQNPRGLGRLLQQCWGCLGSPGLEGFFFPSVFIYLFFYLFPPASLLCNLTPFSPPLLLEGRPQGAT